MDGALTEYHYNTAPPVRLFVRRAATGSSEVFESKNLPLCDAFVLSV